MKKSFYILSLLLSIFISNNTLAQESVPKEVLLNTLNSVNKLKLSNYKTSELMDYNTVYTDKIYTILEGSLPEKDKKAALKTLKSDSEKDLYDLLGKKYFKKYQKLMETELKPLKKKNNLLKYLY